MNALPAVKTGSHNKCKQCGTCCKQEICIVGEIAFGHDLEAPCPALIKKNGKYACAFVLAEKEFHKKLVIAQSLGIGKGCDVGFL